MNHRRLLEDAMHELRVSAALPQQSSIESTFELVTGERAGGAGMQACADASSLIIKDVRELGSLYSSPVEPLSIIMCQERDLACFFDFEKSEFVIEATNAGEERAVIVVADDCKRHGSLGQQEGARTIFALARNKSYTVGLVVLRSPDSLFEEAERIFVSEGPKLESLTLLDRALARNPNLRQAWRRKAYILRELGQHDEALAAAEESVRVDPNYALGWRCKGAILRDMGKHQLGLDCYLRSLALDPTDSVCWTNKGNALSALGKGREAAEAYEEAKRLEGLYPESD